MGQTDYDLPPDWNALSDEEKSDWFTQERCRRQAMRQDTPFAKRVEQEKDRISFLQRVRQFVKLGK
jgi:hypothetical protein